MFSFVVTKPVSNLQLLDSPIPSSQPSNSTGLTVSLSPVTATVVPTATALASPLQTRTRRKWVSFDVEDKKSNTSSYANTSSHTSSVAPTPVMATASPAPTAPKIKRFGLEVYDGVT